MTHNIFMSGSVYFITGIGTDVGKSYATGWLARRWMESGLKVATQKFIQTGNVGRSEDIEIHRKLMGIDSLPEDADLTTSPIIFSYPASPDLAARIDGRKLDLTLADRSSDLLKERYDRVLVEGAGGLMVPLEGEYLTIDYVSDRKLPVILVTNGKLGSVSDTLLALYAIKGYNLRLEAVVYNPWFDNDRTIAADTRKYLRQFLATHFPQASFLEM